MKFKNVEIFAVGDDYDKRCIRDKASPLDEIDEFYASRAEAIWNAHCQGLIDESELPFVCVSAYAVTREYGGPEEGGWWYDEWRLMLTIPIENSGRAPIVKKFLENELGFLKEGDISSVLGGQEVHVRMELERGQYKTKKRPHYE